ncbi:hypothetical protein MLD38_040867 [Melastoma candidum]|nr:hypothetical protein MLD38_040867 [Melastoma candidum]
MDLSEFPSLSDHDSNQNDMMYAMRLATASVLPMVLRSTVELGVLDIIEKLVPGGTISASQVALELGATNPEAPSMIDHMLCLLASHSIVTCSVETDSDGRGSHRFYGLAPVARFFTKNRSKGSLGLLLLLVQDRPFLDMWFHLKDAILEGGNPFERTHGMTTVSYVENNSAFAGLFRDSMTEFNKLFMEEILLTYKGFEGVDTLVDVGGGDGSILGMIRSKYPSIKGINYDLASVIEKLPERAGVQNIAGDMFTSIPKGDAIFIKWVLHSWSDEQCVQILKNTYEALPEGGKVMIVDLVIPEAPEVDVGVQNLFQLYLHVKSLNSTGKERTKKEFEVLSKQAGLSQVQVAAHAFNFSVVELYKNYEPRSS